MIKVFHLPSEYSAKVPFNPESIKKYVKECFMSYQEVAHVNVSTPSEAFELTNTIHDYWWLNEEVIPMSGSENGCRSTSVGDIMLVDGRRWVVVLPLGFEF